MPLRRQELARGDGLDGLAEAHLVGEQRAFAEGEMQHAFALIGQQRMVQHIEAGSAGPDLGEERRARLVARALPARRSSHGVKWRDTRIRRRMRRAQRATRRAAPRPCSDRKQGCRPAR